MAVVSVIEQWEGRGGGADENGVINLNRSWLVETDDQADDVPQVVAAIPVNLFDPHPADPTAVARSIDVKVHEGPKTWRVSIPYSNAPIGTGGAGGTGSAMGGEEPTAQDPEAPTPPTPANSTPAPDRTPEWSFGKKEVREAAEEDGANEPYVNTLGEKLEGMERIHSHMVVTIKYWSINITIPHTTHYWDTANVAPWKGFATNTVWVADFSFEWVYDLIAPGKYGLLQKCTVVLEWNRRGWYTRVLNAGRKARPSSGEPPLVITDETGQPISDPVPLKADGTRWMPGDAYHYLTFQDFELTDFTGLLI